MWKFTRIVCSLPTLLLAGVLCGLLAYLTNPEFLTRIANISSMSGLAICAVGGFFATFYIHQFGNFLLSLGNQPGFWYTKPAGGAYLIVALVLLAIMSYHTCTFVLAPAILKDGLTRWGAVFQILTVVLLVFAFTVGTSGVSVSQNAPPDADDDAEPRPPLRSSENRPQSKPYRCLTHDRD